MPPCTPQPRDCHPPATNGPSTSAAADRVGGAQRRLVVAVVLGQLGNVLRLAAARAHGGCCGRRQRGMMGRRHRRHCRRCRRMQACAPSPLPLYPPVSQGDLPFSGCKHGSRRLSSKRGLDKGVARCEPRCGTSESQARQLQAPILCALAQLCHWQGHTVRCLRCNFMQGCSPSIKRADHLRQAIPTRSGRPGRL